MQKQTFSMSLLDHLLSVILSINSHRLLIHLLYKDILRSSSTDAKNGTAQPQHASAIVGGHRRPSKVTALSARTVACFLASDDDPEKGLCPHQPARSPGMQAITDNLVRNRYRNHKSRRVSRVKEQTNNSTSKLATGALKLSLKQPTQERSLWSRT
jgi:hypothetical protein